MKSLNRIKKGTKNKILVQEKGKEKQNRNGTRERHQQQAS